MQSFAGTLAAIALGIPFGLALAACGGDDTSTSATSTKACGTMASPELLTLKDVTPAAGASVPNADITHGFTVVAAPGAFKSLNLAFDGTKHTAGASSPTAWSFTAAQSGADVRYEAKGISWAKAPAHVAIAAAQKFATADGCVYALPSPLFDYDVTPATGGGGGGGAGQGGAAPGGAGQGGDSPQGGAGQGGASQGGGGAGGSAG